MNSKLMMTSAAILLGFAGMACLFAPAGILNLYGPNTGSTPELLVQQLGATFLGFAALDWISKQSPLGGIYGRSVVAGNFTHFAIGSLLLVRAAMSQPSHTVIWFTLTAYALFGVAFGVILFAPARKPGAPPSV